MHEWALAEAVIYSVSNFAEKKGIKKIREIEIVLGEMQNIDKEVLRLAVKDISKMHGSLFSGFKAKIKDEKTILKCISCGNEWNFSFKSSAPKDNMEAIHFVPEVSHVYIKCPKCGSRDFKIVRGRGVRIKSVKGE